MKSVTRKTYLLIIALICIVSLGACGSRKETEAAVPEDGVVSDYLFMWDGGTMGHVIITCDQVFIDQGHAYATITFSRKDSRSESKFNQVKALGHTIDGENTFNVPVNLNANTEIEAYTIAMSNGHWISYTIFVGYGDIDMTVQNNMDTLDTEIPSIVTLKPEKEVKMKASDYLKVFRYKDGYYLIEIDVSSDNARTGLSMEELELSLDEDDRGLYSYYKNPVIKYLIVPEDKEVPAGLSDYVIIIKQPKQKTYVASDSAQKILTDINATSKIDLTGAYDDWDYKTMIQNQTDLIIESADIFKCEPDQIHAQWQIYAKLVSRAIQMETPMLIDRSGDESDENAIQDWETVYKLILESK